MASVVSNSLWPHELWPTKLFCPWDSPGKNTGVGCHAFLQGIFPTQGSNWPFLNCKWILSHLGSPLISRDRNQINLNRKWFIGLRVRKRRFEAEKTSCWNDVVISLSSSSLLVCCFLLSFDRPSFPTKQAQTHILQNAWNNHTHCAEIPGKNRGWFGSFSCPCASQALLSSGQEKKKRVWRKEGRGLGRRNQSYY